ncbi:MAG: 1-(5-phosphoribosyl)-5-[(5-phosphoribosylamino)methylideneamino]imidazole-4-carboxamide isomerase [Gammaproteobacteria bacterium]
MIIPSIDLHQGECVRLYQGKFDQVTVYHDDPMTIAKDYCRQGASHLHIVDLDGARRGEVQQSELALKIQAASGLQVQIGGGIRTYEDVKQLLDNGIHRVVVGSLAVSQPDLVKQWLCEFGVEQIVLALDVRYNEEKIPQVSTVGWQQDSALSLWDVLDEYQEVEVRHILCTVIDRDGVLGGPDLDLYKKFRLDYPQLQLQASGGVSCLDDLKALKKLKVSGVIIGKALYEKKFTLAEALAVGDPPPRHCPA